MNPDCIAILTYLKFIYIFFQLLNSCFVLCLAAKQLNDLCGLPKVRKIGKGQNFNIFCLLYTSDAADEL